MNQSQPSSPWARHEAISLPTLPGLSFCRTFYWTQWHSQPDTVFHLWGERQRWPISTTATNTCFISSNEGGKIWCPALLTSLIHLCHAFQTGGDFLFAKKEWRVSIPPPSILKLIIHSTNIPYLSNDVTVLSMHLSCRANIPDHTQDLIYLEERKHTLQYTPSVHPGTHLL